ncbi:molybdopterin molybdenumtransferase MoeA [Streptomyces griseus]|uniref:molybdopterin-binding protein n=1 Tax=Streptomyces griseus TaxID=1911 RepID=UPI001C55964D|nr:molybdopterin-binding protein [Streptomyces griseus]MBW3706230.1 molybdopterin molybdenumtransferase MoeA [Streptomyces griseus]
MHRRRRTALAVLAATLVAAPLLSACGNQSHPGAAAVVGGARIEVSTVQDRAADVRSAQENSPEAAQLVNKSGQLNRAKLHGLIFGRILDRAAADAGVTVTRKEIQEMRKASGAQQGGEERFEAMMLQQRWVAPDQIDADMRQEVQLPKLAEALGALTDLPSFDTSAMDGWAVAGPGPWAFEAGAGILAGRGPAAALPDGTAVRIATGARVPPDTTAVIRSEHAHADDAKGLLHARRSVAAGQDIRPRGQECRGGEQLVPAGTVVTPAVLGLAAAAGYDALPAVPRPRVDVLVLGDELLASGLPHDGLIRDALGPMLGPWLRALGAEVSPPCRLGDDAAALRDALTASDADLIVTTGGTAAGPVDHVHPVLEALGAELLVDGVAVRPGHPMLLARLPAPGTPRGRSRESSQEHPQGPPERQSRDVPDGPYLVGLPGNPLAAVSGLLTLAEPLLAGIAGRPAQDAYRALVHAEVHGHPHDTRLVPVVHRAGRPGGRDHVAPLRYNGPAMLRGIAAADGLAVVEPGGVRSGTEVEILDLPWAPATPWTEGCFT